MRIILNLSGRDQPLPVDVTGFRPLLSTIADGEPASPADGLRADEGLLLIMDGGTRSEEHTSELQSLMRISYAVFCLKKKNKINRIKVNTIVNHMQQTKNTV